MHPTINPNFGVWRVYRVTDSLASR